MSRPVAQADGAPAGAAGADEAPPRRLALITGASAGIGAAFARAYAGRGLDVALVARRRPRLEALAAELSQAHGVRAIPIAADLAASEAHAPVMAALAAEGRHADVLVNNAGFGVPRRFLDAQWDEQRDFLMSMAVAPCALAYAVLPGMVERRWGRIVNLGSIAAFSPGVSGNTLYPGVKSLMVRFSQALDAEYRGRGVHVTALCPGSTRTEFAAQAGYQHLVKPSLLTFSQSAETVAEAGVRGVEQGRTVVIPGWRNRLAVALMRTLPEPLVRRAIDAGAARYLVED